MRTFFNWVDLMRASTHESPRNCRFLGKWVEPRGRGYREAWLLESPDKPSWFSFGPGMKNERATTRQA